MPLPHFGNRGTVNVTSDQFYDKANGISLKTHRRFYSIWYGMVLRCTDPRNEAYHRYGERGIMFCPEWASFPGFLSWAIRSDYGEDLTLDRIDNNGNYCPGNCKWQTRKEQSRNTKRNVLVTAWGETKALSAWVEDPRCTVDYRTARYRIKVKRVTPEIALGVNCMITHNAILVTGWGETKSVAEWARDPRCRISPTGLLQRIKAGEPLETAMVRGPQSGKSRLSLGLIV